MSYIQGFAAFAFLKNVVELCKGRDKNVPLKVHMIPMAQKMRWRNWNY